MRGSRAPDSPPMGALPGAAGGSTMP